MPGLWHNGLALGWGLAEATVFFVVPDVLLSWFALEGLKRALVACLFALLGAIVGGCIVWYGASGDAESVRALFAALPAIDNDMIRDVRAQLQAQGLLALFIGPLSGTPYKIYALEGASLGLGFAAFLLISVPARLIRFTLVTLAVAGLSRLVGDRLSLIRKRTLHVVCWTAFYAWYFHAMTAPPPVATV